ncbi:MAG: YabP/YqfC family sporulation protein [Candidatus Faecousia sp.]|nr:sporulation protein YabP [Oscillospiraceae bacterium]MDD6856113.1 YabP/YqfC family sporulation protein [Oscillospiraceae bacterium]MDY2558108.1 YabP/YqfC family sporulation protein [Candidatus Faecousia sp.]
MVQEEHSLRLVGRAELTITGVTEVSRFEEDGVLLQTDMGELTVQGEQLQLKELSLDGGRVAVSGSISALIYGRQQSGGWLHRLLG